MEEDNQDKIKKLFIQNLYKKSQVKMNETEINSSSISVSLDDKSTTDNSNPFTMFYAQLLHQGNMLADHVRTGTYQQAFHLNASDFEGKVVLDVGTGTGILAFFACQAGAKKVYAVDASSSTEVARLLAERNGFVDRVEIISGKIEEIELPEKVDIIISEPIGFLLVHERMLESYVIARDRFLKPGGLMMPTLGSIILAPLSDDGLYKEQLGKIAFWECQDFYGIDISPALDKANVEYFSQPVVGYFPSTFLISKQRTIHCIDFNVVTCEELKNFEIPFTFRIDKTEIMHGMAGWFDINFIGSTEDVLLSTSPDAPGTHWYQCRLLLKDPIAVNKGQFISGVLKFDVNEKFSYNINMKVRLDGTEVESENTIYLHDQLYHYLSSPQV